MQKPMPTKRNGRELAKVEEDHPNKKLKMSLDEVSQDSFKLHWLNETEFLDKEGNQIFRLNEPIKGGIRCVKCEAALDCRHQTNKEYISQDAHLTHRWLPTKHLGTDTHQEALRMVEQQVTSTLARQAAQAKDSTIKCAADQIESVYFITRNDIANDKCEQLQELIASITNSKQLTDFGHVSYQATTDFIKCISDQITTEIQLKIKNLKFGTRMYFHKHLFLIFVPYPQKGATAQNLYETCIQVSIDQRLNLDDLKGICVDGASAMIGCRNSMTSKLKDRYPFIIIVHCCAHRLNLASLDAIKGIEIQPLRTCEAVTQQLWPYFAASLLFASILAAIHSENEDDQIRLKRLVPT
ncbi:MAG: hypothetical protein EZS28_020934 [Streblomastix strix]|uniref:DUF4371 domain-containing protein n=1 Tax=Streblomastix strix TaxID=222440 RepID=A0A5J4VM11_9EUKA|nr:MAG: hypothetical protein EZS28_020934 [Streblomastix strix]